MPRWILFLVAGVGLINPAWANAQLAGQDSNKPPTQFLIQGEGSSQAAIQDNLDKLTKAVALLLRQPISQDIDMTLSEKMIGLENLQIDLTQTVLTYSVDPELRALVSQNVTTSASAIAELKGWQMNREILQKQLRTPNVK